MTAEEAARELGVSMATLYSYVSRGLIRSETADRSRRTRRYNADDVKRLRDKREGRRDPDKMVEEALHWGVPMLDSAITLIDRGRLYYRGQDALELAVTRTVEETAALIWTGDILRAVPLFRRANGALSPRCQALRDCLPEAAPLEAFQMLLPALAAEDLAAYDLRPDSVAVTGARLLRLLAAIAVGHVSASDDGVAVTLQRAWRPDDPGAARLLTAALILCADHELNISSFTARCVASAGSPPHAAVNAGLSALQGGKHGGATARVEALFREAGSPHNARAVIAARIRRGEAIPGFGHRLYLEGDPRGRLLLELTLEAYPYTPAIALATALAREARMALDDAPNIDFGLTTLCGALELPAGAPMTLFALGRTIGWIGHACEEYEANRLIRPRARYTGVMPEMTPKMTEGEG